MMWNSRFFQVLLSVLLVSLIMILTGCSSGSLIPIAGSVTTVPPPEENRLSEPNLLQKLHVLEDVEIKKIPADSGFSEAYEILLQQPLDHSSPGGVQFKQRLLLQHRGFGRPTVMVTEGYALGHNYCGELKNILSANELRVEHRYFGRSLPDSMDWEYLNIDQAAQDYHRIRRLFTSIYPRKWISSGWSKGGQTALIYKSKYPADVTATVAYDAPLSFSAQDPRIDAFFETVGSDYCRKKLVEFQRRVLKKKDEILPRFHWYCKGKGYEYSIGEEKALEFIVLEYPFSFWQYTEIKCEVIPDENATVDELLEHLDEVVSFSSYSDKAMHSPAMYQFSTELGYYGYVQKNVADLLANDNYSNALYAPREARLEFNPQPMQDLNNWLQINGNNIIFIYGKNDPWSAPAVNVSAATNALKVFVRNGNHYSFINSLEAGERSRVIRRLKDWLKPGSGR